MKGGERHRVFDKFGSLKERSSTSGRGEKGASISENVSSQNADIV